jgi:hypothetical protein
MSDEFNILSTLSRIPGEIYIPNVLQNIFFCTPFCNYFVLYSFLNYFVIKIFIINSNISIHRSIHFF